MTAMNRKYQILESINSLDQHQAEKVLNYIKGLTDLPKEDSNYQRMKTEAMKDIRNALGTERNSSPGI
jgi:ERCC4-type nuclease